MFTLKNWPIARRITLAVSIPLFAAIGFGGVIIFDSWRTMNTTSRMAAATSMSPLFGAFIHELQIERGLTNAILRHPENRAASEARNTQTSHVDSALDALRRTIEAMSGDVGDRDAANARAALKRADDLLDLRAAVSKGGIEPGAAVARYTGLIDAALGERFMMEFEDGTRTAARTMGLKDGFAGVQFDQPLSAIANTQAA
jgi:hypothetical protein